MTGGGPVWVGRPSLRKASCFLGWDPICILSLSSPASPPENESVHPSPTWGLLGRQRAQGTVRTVVGFSSFRPKSRTLMPQELANPDLCLYPHQVPQRPSWWEESVPSPVSQETQPGRMNGKGLDHSHFTNCPVFPSPASGCCLCIHCPPILRPLEMEKVGGSGGQTGVFTSSSSAPTLGVPGPRLGSRSWPPPALALRIAPAHSPCAGTSLSHPLAPGKVSSRSWSRSGPETFLDKSAPA